MPNLSIRQILGGYEARIALLIGSGDGNHAQGWQEAIEAGAVDGPEPPVLAALVL